MQTIYQKMETTELDAAIEALKAEVAEVKAKGLALDMARGKPSPSQVDISRPMLDILNADADLYDGNVDCSNYGCLRISSTKISRIWIYNKFGICINNFQHQSICRNNSRHITSCIIGIERQRLCVHTCCHCDSGNKSKEFLHNRLFLVCFVCFMF